MPSVARASCLICGSQRLQPFLNLVVEGAPHGGPEHNFTYVYRIMTRCGECGHGQLEIYSHDCFNHYADEDWDMYWWYVLRPARVLRLRALLEGCPDRLNVQCRCALHYSLRESCGRLWGGIKHAVDPTANVKFAWLLLDEQPDHVALKVDQQHAASQAA